MAKPIKIFNKAGDAGIIAAFNISADNTSVKDTKIEIELAKDTCEIYNFYPIKDGKVYLGDLTKYISSASSKRVETKVNELVCK